MIILVIISIDAKQVQKRSTVALEVPTIPLSDNHTDDTWNDTDIYSGEFFVNEADYKVYVRIADKIFEFGLKKDIFAVPGGGQSVFPLSKNMLSDFEVFEDGVLSIRVFSKTQTNEVTCTTTIPEGTNIKIIY